MNDLAPTFDYAALTKTDRVVVEQKTAEIRDRMGRAALNIAEMGERLIVVQEKLPGAKFDAWLDAEFGWGRRTAFQMMSVYRKFGADSALKTIAPSALYLLASDSIPEEVRSKFVEAAKNGEQVTHKEVLAAVTPPRITHEQGAQQAKELDAVDPLLIKHHARQEEQDGEADEPEAEEEDDAEPAPQTWNGRVIPADAPPLNVDAIVKNDPVVRFSKAILRIQDALVLVPAKDVFDQLPKDKQKYVRERFASFGKQFSEAF